MHVFSWLTRVVYDRPNLSMFDMHNQDVESIGAECRSFMAKGSFVELGLFNSEGMVKGNEARTGVDKGGAQISAG